MQPATLSDKVLVIYCFIDDFLNKIQPEHDKQRKFSDAQVITTSLIAANSTVITHLP